MDLSPITIKRRLGTENFHDNGKAQNFDLLNFWQWSASDIVSNATRGVLAEYIVAQALGMIKNQVREEWAAFDLETPNGVKVEVKSAAFIQSWRQNQYSKM